jgi:hypothetical protein
LLPLLLKSPHLIHFQGKSLSIICSALQWLRDNENNLDLDSSSADKLAKDKDEPASAEGDGTSQETAGTAPS